MPNFSSITFDRLKNEVENYLKDEHNKASVLFSPASPYGQILTVLENLHQLSFFPLFYLIALSKALLFASSTFHVSCLI